MKLNGNRCQSLFVSALMRFFLKLGGFKYNSESLITSIANYFSNQLRNGKLILQLSHQLRSVDENKFFSKT